MNQNQLFAAVSLFSAWAMKFFALAFLLAGERSAAWGMLSLAVCLVLTSIILCVADIRKHDFAKDSGDKVANS